MGQLGRCSVFFGELLFEIGILVERSELCAFS